MVPPRESISGNKHRSHWKQDSKERILNFPADEVEQQETEVEQQKGNSLTSQNLSEGDIE